MNKSSAFRSEKIHILDAGIISFSIQNKSENPLEPKDIEQLDFHVQAIPSFRVEEKLAKINLYIRVDAYGDDTELLKKEIGVFDLGFLYQVENLEELLSEEEQQIKVDATLALHLAAISYSSARGLILAKVAGTCLSGAILPIVEPAKLLKIEE